MSEVWRQKIEIMIEKVKMTIQQIEMMIQIEITNKTIAKMIKYRPDHKTDLK